MICPGQTLDKAFLVLDYLPLSSEHPYGWQALGHQLAFLHQADDQAMYGFDWDNYLSATLQPNQWQAKLVDIFLRTAHRLATAITGRATTTVWQY